MENELRRVVDALPGLVWSVAPDRQIDFVNQRWCEYTGLSFHVRAVIMSQGQQHQFWNQTGE